MAKKDKKSKQDQVHKKLPQEFTLDDLDETDLEFLKGLDGDYGDKIVVDGYRIVGPSQAILDYAKPLLDNCVNDEEMEQVLSLVQMFWMLAILEGTESAEETEIKEKLAELNSPEAEELFQMMRERFNLMFPHLKEESPFYIKERVLEIEEFEPFDESTLQINEDVILPTEDERNLAETLRVLDDENNNLDDDINDEDNDLDDDINDEDNDLDDDDDFDDDFDEDIDEYEDKLMKWEEKLMDCFVNWCHAKGISEANTHSFAEAVYNFLGFLYDDYLELLSDHVPEEAIQEFMQSHYIKKVWNTSLDKSMMPTALKLFMRYLDEKGIVPGTKSIINIIESEQKEFLRNLKLYTNPALEEKS
jgi:hypothetical protein